MKQMLGQVKSNSKIANLVKDYLRRYGVKFTYRINKHIEATERLFKGNPDDIKLAMVAMPINWITNSYGQLEKTLEGTRIILFLNDKICIYGQGIISGGKSRVYQLSEIHDVVVNEGLVWATITINYKQTNNAHESSITLGRVHKQAIPALQSFFAQYSNAKFKKTFSKVDDEEKGLTENFDI